MSRQITISQKETPKKVATTCKVTIGIDIGDRWSHYCILDEEEEVVEEGRFRTTATSVGKHFQDVPAARMRSRQEHTPFGLANSWPGTDMK